MHKIKTLLYPACFCFFLLAGSAQAAAYEKGSKTAAFGLNGVDSEISLSGQFGYYVIDYLEAGIQGGFDKGDDNDSLWQVGPYAEYYFPQVRDLSGLPVLPFLGLSGTYYNFDGEGVTGGSGYVGLRWHLNESFALYGAYEQRVASEEIFVDDGEISDSDGLFRYGLRYFF